MRVRAVDVNLVAQEEYLAGGLGGIARYCREQSANLERIKPVGSCVRITGIREDGLLGMFSTKALGPGFRPSSRITHNLTERPLIPARRDNTVLINTAHEFQRILYPEITRAEGRLISEMPGYLLKKSYMRDILKGDYIIAVSGQTKSEAMRLGFENEVFVVNLGIGDEFMRGRKRIPRKPGKLKVGYIGAVRKRKGIGMLLESMKHLGDDFELRIYGTVFDRYRNEFERLMRTARNATYMGIAPQGGLVDLYDSFDAFVMPSVYEGFGLGILEAQARGVPVIISGKGMLPRETSRYCMKADNAEGIAKILWRLKDIGYDDSLRRTAMKYARSFTWMKTAEKTLKVYEGVS